MIYITLLFVWLNAAVCNNVIEKRNVDLKVKWDNPGVDYYEADFDNVFYSYYKPKKENEIKSISESLQLIWVSPDLNVSCKYALVAYKNIDPHLVYLLLTEGDDIAEEYYQKIGVYWRKIDERNYKEAVEFLKYGAEYRPVTLFLSNQDNTPSYYVQNFEGTRPYRFFCLRYGYGARRVFYKGEIWASQDEDERCVAVWAYKTDGVSIQYVKLLTTKGNGVSDVLEFTYSNNKWRQCVPGEHYANSPNVDYLENFVHPEYANLDKKAEIKFPAFEMEIAQEKYVYNNDPELLFIDKSIVNSHGMLYRECMDDVVYYHYHPKSPDAVKRILDSSEKVWSAYGSETCSYALIAFEGDNPVLAYLYLKVEGETRSLFLRKGPEGWERSDLKKYAEKVEMIKSDHKFVEYHRLDLYSSFNNKYYDISMGRGYVTYLANYGVRIAAVSYISQEIWTSEKGERCVGVWAYENGFYYMLKLLIAHKGKSELLMFYRIDNLFRRVDAIQMEKAPGGEKEYYLEVEGTRHYIPEERVRACVDGPRWFYYPDYEFTPKIRELYGSYPMDEYEHIYSDYADIFGPEANEYMAQVTCPLYQTGPATEVDIADLDKTVASSTEAVYEGVLEMKLIEPLPGTYFSKIAENRDVMYSQPSIADASVGVAVYTVEGKNVLADVMLAASRPASIHLEKVGGEWKYISGKKFEERLLKLKEDGRKVGDKV
ncbi:uncharacterized protein TOT_040000487 [Theileria orientalis strain Shintoku]|uniref:Uncharacterized protein n=1 Tax=Theileria orientalis strain Shintoku TaxID=869250 RepID=J4DQA5_THEOR|nr:uncharacterized protein TOT_040000487 [Theileria orientalis strain Shintoku]PVC50869.1 hypothetical protein MACL_00001986 [Theileria orientalis]BAM42114.1 uncharacterized protein TOT_040000487 [Theileria orientalis strain Shintoku]|eukprot:XP_009692415.1 uncharacterized protein TOT_040000487 [Theileria orientalis strain Shintoku]